MRQEPFTTIRDEGEKRTEMIDTLGIIEEFKSRVILVYFLHTFPRTSSGKSTDLPLLQEGAGNAWVVKSLKELHLGSCRIPRDIKESWNDFTSASEEWRSS